jgi:flavin reductase (DIM6/NTAB) family NADH-FMN oxidoreductase RutF
MEDSVCVDINDLLQRVERVLWLVTSQMGARRNGLIATFVTAASIVYRQPRIVIGIANHHYTHELIENSGVMALHLLKESQLDWVWRFGTQSGRTTNKFAGLATRRARYGSPVLVDAMGWVEGLVETKMRTGDRTVYLIELVDGQHGDLTEQPLTETRMRELAPPDKQNLLAQLLRRDAGIDAYNIKGWRDRAIHKA